jgi:hypothetical protein
MRYLIAILAAAGASRAHREAGDTEPRPSDPRPIDQGPAIHEPAINGPATKLSPTSGPLVKQPTGPPTLGPLPTPFR